MLLTISTTHQPATDLGFLLHKNPDRLQTFSTSFGNAHVFYPEASDERCTVVLLLEIDPVELVRGSRRPGHQGTLDQYVNDRPYVASSFMSVALGRVFSTALSGRCKERPELAETSLPLEARIAVLPSRGGEPFVRRLFEPLGYDVEIYQQLLDERFPEWGESPYLTLSLRANIRLADLLSHLYVLIPVLDDEKHYWVGEDEVEKLMRRGKGWLASHPARAAITDRYLRRKRHLTRAALARLVAEEDPDPDEDQEDKDVEEAAVEERISLNEQRLGSVVAALKASGARRVLDLGCGEGRLIAALLKERGFEEIVGMDVSYRTLERAQGRLKLDRLAPKQRERVKLIQGSLTYRDARLAGYDAAAVVEVIEHLDPPRLTAFERVVFEEARPRTVVVTTPNREFNVRFETLPAGRLRHRDHRFEWSRREFQDWAARISQRFEYAVRFLPVGPEDPEVGSPTQMAVFSQ